MSNPENKFGVSLQGFIPLRKDPFERAEMISQVLFGEYVEILDDEARWLYIKTINDQYEGWIDKKCIVLCTQPDTREVLIAISNTKLKNLAGDTFIFIPVGSFVPEVSGNKFSIEGHEFMIENMDAFIKPGKLAIKDLAENILSTPYLWGGKCGYGFDCSGMVQYILRASGKQLPRDSSDQAAVGDTLSFINETKTGDLAFFDDTEGMIHHVGIIIENNRIIHASGTVRIDKIDQQGIYKQDLGAYTHKLRVLKRVLGG